MKLFNTLIFIPTYNEKENVAPLLQAINELKLPVDVCFMDDASPDGTGEFLEKLVPANPGLIVLHREGKLGIGSAHQGGIKYAYENGYERLITLDCDFSHPPEYIPALLEQSQKYDIVVGSRYMFEDSLKGWNLFRKSLTHLGHFLTNLFLKLPYDATGAFRLYNLKTVPSYVFPLVSSSGYSFFYESLFILNFNKFSIKEIPIKLPPRTYGHSKMAWQDIWTSLKFLFFIYLNLMVNKERFQAAEPFGEIDINLSKDTQGWDNYWQGQKSANRLLYDAVAAFYRKFIIRPSLNYFVKKYFARDVKDARGANDAKAAKILHAGCGCGPVDMDVRNHVKLTALDISPNALGLYRRVHGGAGVKLVHGSIFALPFKDGEFDGIYNLGVMEHFTEQEIDSILSEFRRVLAERRRLLIFWPPEYGLSVCFFKGLGLLYRKILKKKNVRFHPDEITRLRSEDHARAIFQRNKFRILSYSFGVRDLFTYAVVVAERE